MKKRINNSEIEKAKNSSRIVFVLTILMLLVVICGLLFYVIYDKGLIKFKNEEKNVPEQESIFSSEKSEIHVDDSRIITLYNAVKITANECDGYNTEDNINVKKMNSKCKFSLASNIYNDYLEKNDDYEYITEENVKNAYEYLFGYNSYESLENIPYNTFYSLTLNDVNKEYFSNEILNDVDTSVSSYEKIISISRKGNYLNIISVPLFFNKPEKVLCKDYDCNEVIENNVKDNNEDYYDLYLDHNKDKLNQYKYKFKMDNVGFYRYVGFEKTNS